MRVIVSIIDSDEFYEFKDATEWKDENDWIKFYKEIPVNGRNINPDLVCLGWVKRKCVEAIEIDEDEEESY